MSMQDPIADMFTRIRNAQSRIKPSTNCPATKYKIAILDVLKREGYIRGYDKLEVNGKPEIKIHLKYHQGKPVIEEIRRIAKPSLPIYRAFDDMAPVCNGLGIRMISTSQGVFSDKELRSKFATTKKKLGGVVIGEVI
jgi:small subunit ribosomal protein S8